MQRGLVGSEMCIRDSINAEYMGKEITFSEKLGNNIEGKSIKRIDWLELAISEKGVARTQMCHDRSASPGSFGSTEDSKQNLMQVLVEKAVSQNQSEEPKNKKLFSSDADEASLAINNFPIEGMSRFMVVSQECPMSGMAQPFNEDMQMSQNVTYSS
eukprot:TRINITY_DN3164_c0_g1_i1.p3 TRINITY_DN3164_c0_g1~~TRINITY_DN3164_c0_g1_i1.p3  ORF type:complete len:157 (-),score=31.01 TRINITY_DN3164_c0_g1_i1:43-513(-)